MKLKSLIIALGLGTGIMLSMSSFNTATAKRQMNETTTGNIEFKITNNTGTKFEYCVNGGHNTLSSWSTRSFSYSSGQYFNYIEGSSCGTQWFEVTSDMNGKYFKLSDLL